MSDRSDEQRRSSCFGAASSRVTQAPTSLYSAAYALRRATCSAEGRCSQSSCTSSAMTARSRSNQHARSMRSQVLGFIAWLAVVFAAASVGAIASIDADTFYGQLQKPSWAPPASVFGPVWSALYALMGLALLVLIAATIVSFWRLNRLANHCFYYGSVAFRIAGQYRPRAKKAGTVFRTGEPGDHCSR